MASVKITPNISVASKKYRPRKILPPQQSMKCTFLLPFPQCFSLPLDVVRHLFKNSKTSNVLLKLYQTCKYFYSKNQILIVSGKVTKQMPIVRYKFANNNNMKNIKKPYFWFDNDLFIKEEYFFNFQKIYRSTIKTLIIHGPLKFTEFKVLVAEGTVETFQFNNIGRIRNTYSRAKVTIADILQLLPNVKKFWYFNLYEQYSNNTLKNLISIKSNFRFKDIMLEIHQVTETFDAKLLFWFILKNAEPFCTIRLLSRAQESEAIISMLQTAEEKFKSFEEWKNKKFEIYCS